MTEPQFYEIGSVPPFIPSSFADTQLDFPFVVNQDATWNPRKSYFRIGLTVTGAGGQPNMYEMVAPADNAAGNLFSSATLRCGMTELSSCQIGLAQASALEARLESSTGFIDSIGDGSDLHVAQFEKRNIITAIDSGAESHIKSSKNTMYRPVTSLTFRTAQIAGAGVLTESVVRSAYDGAVPPVLDPTLPVVENKDAANPYAAIANVVVPLSLVTGAVVTCASGLFTTGMPQLATNMPTGGPVEAGDILVINDIRYPILTVTNATTLVLAVPLHTAIVATANWYILRKDMLRAPQARNVIYVNWRPPMGIMKYDGPLGAGMYTMSLTPSGLYKQAAIESKNPLSVVGTSYNLSISDVKFYTFIAKAPIQDGIYELPLIEYQVQTKPWSSSVEFTVPPTTESLTIFIQDSKAGNDPLIPPSMFKCLDNSDLRLKTINVSYGGYSKPATQILSNFYDSINQLQSRYRNTYEESGIDVAAVGCESYEDWLERGPFYHFTFNQDINSHATAVSVTTSFNNGDPTGGLTGTGAAWVYCIAHYRNRAQITSARGRVVQSQLLF